MISHREMPRLRPHKMKLMKLSGESVQAVLSPDWSLRQTAIHHDYRSAPESSCGATLFNDPIPGAGKHSPYISVHRRDLTQLPAHDRCPGLVLQPDSSPISRDQQKAKFKGIYAGLVTVEAKCVSIDAAQAAHPSSPLGPEQWQALVALHRTLLYEHHDFLMATQHPSSIKTLRGLATKYSLPVRMWKRGIHALLELFCHCMPISQDYMLSFIYLAYQMMALLFETVSAFTDTWIECLGDFARYRMAIEEDKEVHALRGDVAARWYTLASDRHPRLGRLYHHLGIVERPSLREFWLYARSLTCKIPFTNAQDSLATLYRPIFRYELSASSSIGSAGIRAVTLHALMSSRTDTNIVDEARSYTLDLIRENSERLRDLGAYLAIVNLAPLSEVDSATDLMFHQYAKSFLELIRLHQNSMATESRILTLLTCGSIPKNAFWTTTFNNIMSSYNWTLHEHLFLHVVLFYIHSLHILRIRALNECVENDLFWVRMAEFINTLVKAPITAEADLDCARRGSLWTLERTENFRPLSEDYLLRGLVWSQFYFSPGWFDAQNEDNVRAIEIQNLQTGTAQRVLQLAPTLSRPHTEPVKFDVRIARFSSPGPEEWQRQSPSPALKTSYSQSMISLIGAFQSTASGCLLGLLGLLTMVSQLLPCTLIPLMMSSMAIAAPTGIAQSRNSTKTVSGPNIEKLIDTRVSQWMELFEKLGFSVAAGIIILATILNIVRLFLQKPKKLPKMSRDAAIIFALLSWALIDISPSSTHWILLTVLLWFCLESHYVGKMCWFTINGRVYFWTTVGSGLVASMFLPALLSDARPTLSTMIRSGRGPAAFFISCAARLLPNAVGVVRS